MKTRGPCDGVKEFSLVRGASPAGHGCCPPAALRVRGRGRCALRRSRWVSVSLWFRARPRERFQSRHSPLQSYFSPSLVFPSSSSFSLRWKMLRLDLHLRRQLCSGGKVLSLKDKPSRPKYVQTDSEMMIVVFKMLV